MNTEDAETLSPPALVAPCDAASVDGREVTFVWNPVAEADTYRLEVAPTADFEDSVVDVEVDDQTAVTVGNRFPMDGQTFFWRVRAGAGGRWSEGGTVESFLATTAKEADEDIVLAAADGHGLRLVGASDRAEEVETVDFTERFQAEREQGVAYEGVATRQILGISVSIMVVILIAVSVLFGWFEQVSNNAQSAAMAVQEYEQLRQVEVEATEQLQQYGVVNEGEGTYRIPIDRAMDLIATEEYQQRQAEGQ